MRFIYFVLIPFLVSGRLVYRGVYSNKGETNYIQSLTVIAFAIVYCIKFGIFIGTITTAAMIIFWLVWAASAKSLNLKGR